MNNKNKKRKKIKTAGANVRRRIYRWPHVETNRMLWNWDDQLKRYVGGLTSLVDTLLLGRKLVEGFIPYWAANP